MTKEHPLPMASAHPGRRIDGTDPKRQAEHDDRALDRALQDLYAAYGDDTSPPEELMALAREAAAALVGNPVYDDATPKDASSEASSQPDAPPADALPADTVQGGGKRRSDEHTS